MHLTDAKQHYVKTFIHLPGEREKEQESTARRGEEWLILGLESGHILSLFYKPLRTWPHVRGLALPSL